MNQYMSLWAQVKAEFCNSGTLSHDTWSCSSVNSLKNFSILYERKDIYKYIELFFNYYFFFFFWNSTVNILARFFSI